MLRIPTATEESSTDALPDFPRMFGGQRRKMRKAKARVSEHINRIQRIPTERVDLKDLPICLRRYYEHIGKAHIWDEPYAYPKSLVHRMRRAGERVYVLIISDVPCATFTCAKEATLTCKALQAFMEGVPMFVCPCTIT